MKKEVRLKCNLGLCRSYDIVNNVFDSVRAVYKGLNNIKSETGVKTGVAITGLGIHFDSVKDKLGFSISVEKKELRQCGRYAYAY